MNLTIAAIKRPILVAMFMIATIMMGILSYRNTRVELNPDVEFGVITITTIYPGAGPEEINNLITRRIEDAVSGVSGIRQINGTSQDSVSSVVVNLEIGTDVDETATEFRNRIDAIKRDLPTDAEDPIVAKIDTTSSPTMTLVASSETLSSLELRDVLDNELKDEFSRLPGVGSVSVAGGDQREIHVRLRHDDMLRYGVGILDIQRAIQASSLNVPAGRITENGREVSVRVTGEAKTVEDLGNIRVRLTDPNQPFGLSNEVLLSDIATIEDAEVEKRSNFRLDGEDAVAVTIFKSKTGTAVEVSHAILTKTGQDNLNMLERITRDKGIDFIIALDTSVQIEESLFDLQFALGFGIVLVMFVTWMFLHDWRGTVIVATAIPVCIFAALIMVPLFGFTLNTITLVALSLAIGVLVDDAIVVIENTYRHLTMGEEPETAAINGRAEIGIAAIAITLADVVVFLPIAFMGGIIGQFYKPLGLTYATCVLVSLIVSFTVTPMLAARMFRKGEDFENPKGWFARGFNKFFTKFSNRYAKTLRWSLDHRWMVFGMGFAILVGLFIFIGGTFMIAPEDASGNPDFKAGIGPALAQGASMQGPAFMVVVLGLAIFIGNLILKRRVKWDLIPKTLMFFAIFPLAFFGGYAYRNLYKQEDVFKFAFLPPSDAGRINVDIELAPDASLAATTETVKLVESRIADHPDIHFLYTSVGSLSAGFAQSSSGTNLARLQVILYDKAALLDRLPWAHHDEPLREKPDTTVASEFVERIGKVPGAVVKVQAESGFAFGAPIQMSFQSEDRDLALATAEKVIEGLKSGRIAGVIQPDLTSKPGKPELRVIPDPAKQGLDGVTTQQLGLALRTMFEGDEQVKYREGGLEYDVRVMMSEEEKTNSQLLTQIPVTFVRGRPIYVNDVATVVNTVSVDKIDRVDRKPEVRVETNLLPGFAAGSVQGEIDRWLEEDNIVPSGVTYKPLGQADAQARESQYLFGAILLGLVLVYFVLASLYNNFLYPLIIQLAQPQAMVGAILALLITDTTLNVIAFIGIVAMIGLVGKNAILLVDYTNTLRERGEPRYDALVESGRTRLRPILMTTISLIVGLLPVALAIGRGSEFRETIGITVIGGATLSTLLTLLVIPCSYSIFDDASITVGKFFAKFRRPEEPEVAPAEEN
ncbi:MAG: efflux RND transporter permease subunit [Fimbriimonadaceae bacterium]|nr:efflux RND transporter permease subunit [Fimbriimonadaceae bacterium]